MRGLSALGIIVHKFQLLTNDLQMRVAEILVREWAWHGGRVYEIVVGAGPGESSLPRGLSTFWLSRCGLSKFPLLSVLQSVVVCVFESLSHWAHGSVDMQGAQSWIMPQQPLLPSGFRCAGCYSEHF